MIGDYSNSKARQVKILKANKTAIKDVFGNPPAVVHEIEMEYIIQADVQGMPYYFCFVVIEVDANRGKTYFELCVLSGEQAQFWEAGPTSTPVENKFQRDHEKQFHALVPILLSRNQSNVIVELFTPYKQAGIPAKKQDGMVDMEW